jgi:hypothetical protein
VEEKRRGEVAEARPAAAIVGERLACLALHLRGIEIFKVFSARLVVSGREERAETAALVKPPGLELRDAAVRLVPA